MCLEGKKAQARTSGTHTKILAISKSNFKVDSASLYKESTTLEYSMILDWDRVLRSMT